MGSLQGVIDTWETYKVSWVHGKQLTRCDRYMGNLQGVMGTWETTDKV